MGQFRGEWSSARGIAELDLRHFVFRVQIGHFVSDRCEIELVLSLNEHLDIIVH
jgi:hypothetical protein